MLIWEFLLHLRIFPWKIQSCFLKNGCNSDKIHKRGFYSKRKESLKSGRNFEEVLLSIAFIFNPFYLYYSTDVRKLSKILFEHPNSGGSTRTEDVVVYTHRKIRRILLEKLTDGSHLVGTLKVAVDQFRVRRCSERQNGKVSFWISVFIQLHHGSRDTCKTTIFNNLLCRHS